MKEFFAKHKKIVIIIGVIVGIILALLVYGIVMSKKNAPKAKYVWNGKEQKLGELGADTPLPANVYLTEEGNLRLDFYGVGSNVETESEEPIFAFDSYLDDALFAENAQYKSSLTVSFLDALKNTSYEVFEASTETDTEAGKEEDNTQQAAPQEQEPQEQAENIVVPLVDEEEGAAKTEEGKEEVYDATKEENRVAEQAARYLGISLPHESFFSIQAAGFGVRYEFGVVIDRQGHINVQTIGAKEIDISFEDVEGYSEVAAAFPNIVIPEGVKVEGAIDDYRVEDHGETDFPSKLFRCLDYKNGTYVYIVMTELKYKDKLVEFFGNLGTDSGTIEANGKTVTIYDVRDDAHAIFSDDTAAYCIYGYDKDTMKQVVGGYIK